VEIQNRDACRGGEARLLLSNDLIAKTGGHLSGGCSF